jgi:hypothetical protein
VLASRFHSCLGHGVSGFCRVELLGRDDLSGKEPLVARVIFRRLLQLCFGLPPPRLCRPESGLRLADLRQRFALREGDK